MKKKKKKKLLKMYYLPVNFNTFETLIFRRQFSFFSLDPMCSIRKTYTFYTECIDYFSTNYFFDEQDVRTRFRSAHRTAHI